MKKITTFLRENNLEYKITEKTIKILDIKDKYMKIINYCHENNLKFNMSQEAYITNPRDYYLYNEQPIYSIKNRRYWIEKQ